MIQLSLELFTVQLILSIYVYPVLGFGPILFAVAVFIVLEKDTVLLERYRLTLGLANSLPFLLFDGFCERLPDLICCNSILQEFGYQWFITFDGVFEPL